MAGVISLVFLGGFLAVAGAISFSVTKLMPPSNGWEEYVIHGTGEIVRRYLEGCYLVLVSPHPSPNLVSLLRALSIAGTATINLELEALLNSEFRYISRDDDSHSKKKESSWEWLWEVGKANCRALLLDHTSGNVDMAGWFLTSSGLSLHTRGRVVVFGSLKDMPLILKHSALRNTRHVLYIAPSAPSTLSRTKAGEVHIERKKYARVGEQVILDIYCRCLYCDAGESSIKLFHRWNLLDGLPKDLDAFAETPLEFMGHKFRIVAKNYFPYFTYERVTDLPGTLVIPKDSLGTRITAALAKHLNFTYEVREPEDNQWGLPSIGGNWTGIVGELQHGKADFCMDLTLTPERAKVVEYYIFIDESVVILSSKPRPLPEYMSLVRPLEGQVWIGVVVCVMVWGTMLWILQKLRHWTLGGHHLSFSSSVFYGWGLLLEDIPYQPPTNHTGKVTVALWLIVCLVLSTAYRSSLISHLVVQEKSTFINSFEDMVDRGERDGWTWGTPRMTGALKTYFSTSPDKTMQTVYKKMMAIGIHEGMEKVLQEGFSFIYSYYYSRTRVATDYTDETGYTPVHISATKYPLFAGNARVFRPGAPFNHRISMATQHLIESGLITFWMDDVISNHVRKERRRKMEGRVIQQQALLRTDGDGQVVLGLNHLQVAYYTLFIGHMIGLFSFFIECMSRSSGQ